MGVWTAVYIPSDFFTKEFDYTFTTLSGISVKRGIYKNNRLEC